MLKYVIFCWCSCRIKWTWIHLQKNDEWMSGWLYVSAIGATLPQKILFRKSGSCRQHPRCYRHHLQSWRTSASVRNKIQYTAFRQWVNITITLPWTVFLRLRRHTPPPSQRERSSYFLMGIFNKSNKLKEMRKQKKCFKLIIIFLHSFLKIYLWYYHCALQIARKKKKNSSGY